MPNFMLIPDADGKEWILNLDQVRMVTNISEGSLCLIFSENHSVNLTGDVAKALLSFFGKNCVWSDGRPLPEIREEIVRRRAASQAPSTQI
jgi:hypothetical protein